jgi:hypothetical protein
LKNLSRWDLTAPEEPLDAEDAEHLERCGERPYDPRMMAIARKIRRLLDSPALVEERHRGEFVVLAANFHKLTGQVAPPLELDPRDTSPAARTRWKLWRAFVHSPERPR